MLLLWFPIQTLLYYNIQSDRVLFGWYSDPNVWNLGQDMECTAHRIICQHITGTQYSTLVGLPQWLLDKHGCWFANSIYQCINSNLMESLLYFHLNFYIVIATQFCTFTEQSISHILCSCFSSKFKVIILITENHVKLFYQFSINFKFFEWWIICEMATWTTPLLSW